MGSDPIRAIVELVTNADDAYLSTPSTRRSKIRIEVERHRASETLILVLDKAKGMTPDEMVLKLTKEGARSSGFEVGEDRRGLLGRGAKDIVHFGKAIFESERQGQRARLEFNYEAGPTGTAELTYLPSANRRAHGTEVSLFVQPRFKVPLHDRLSTLLTRHFALRPILLDQQREVTLTDVGRREDRLIYRQPKGRLLENRTQIEIPGYEDSFGIVTLYEADDSLDDGQPREYWRHSLLITSGRAAYEVFEGKFRREPWSAYLGRLYGNVEVPAIANLIRAYDDAVDNGGVIDERNPIRLVKRDRSSLVNREEHPFVDALYTAVEAVLQPHLDRIRQEVEDSQEAPIGADLQKRLRDVGHLLSRLLQEEEIAAGTSVTAGQLPPLGLTILPSERIAEPGSSASMLVRLREEDMNSEVTPLIDVSVTDDTGEARNESLALEVRSGYFSKTFTLKGRAEGAVTEVTFRYKDFTQTGFFEWRHRTVERVERLEFEHANYAIKEGMQRTVKLLAPLEVALLQTDLPSKSLTGSADIFLTSSEWTVGYDEERQCGAYILNVRGRGIGSRARLLASLGDATAECELLVTSAGVQGLDVRIVELDISQRAYVDAGILKVNAKDPSISRYLGPKRKGWLGQNELHFRTLLAEIVCFTLSRYVVQQRQQGKSQEPAEVFASQMRLMDKWLPRVHSVLVSTRELPRFT
jgi:hypothetical protein